MAYDAFVSYSHAADGRLAPALQQGMQRLAKSWFRPRALRVFRDESALSANPHLWSSIEQALDDSTWFVLLASPDAVASQWVNRELDYWLAHKSVDNILPVVTDGTWEWTDDGGLQGTAVLPALRDAFVGEPRHIDLRWAHDVDDVDLHNTSFRDAVAQLAAPVHGVAKDDLESEDVRQHRRARRLARAAVAALTVLLVAALIGAAVAVHQTNNARAQTRRAARALQEADVQRLVGQSGALLDTKRDLGMLLALEANRRVDRVDTRGALLTALQHEPTFLGYIRQGTANSNTAVFTHDGRRLVLGHDDGTVSVVDVTTHRVIGRPFHAVDGPIGLLALAPDGKSVFLDDQYQFDVRHFDLASGRLIRKFAIGKDVTLGSFAVSADGTRLAAGGYVPPPEQPPVYVWDVATGRLVTTLHGAPSRQTPDNSNGPNRAGLAYSRTGLLAVGSEASVVTLFDGRSFAKVGELRGVPGVVGFRLLFNRDGSKLVTGDSRQNGLMLWDVATRKPIWPARVSIEQFAVAFTPSDDVLVSNRFGKIVTLSGKTGEAIGAPISLQTGSICNFDVSPDGTTLAAADCNEPTVGLFSLDDRASIATLLGHNSGLGAYSPDGKLLFNWNGDRQIIEVRDARTLRVRYTFTDRPWVYFTADSKHMVAGTEDGRGGLFDYRTGRFVGTPQPIPDLGQDSYTTQDPVTGHIAVGYNDGSVRIFDSTGHEVAPRGIKLGDDVQQSTQVHGLSFTPDGRVLVAAVQDEKTYILDARTGKQIHAPIPRAANARVSPDGKLLATAAFNGTVTFYDMRTFKPVGPVWIGSRAWASSMQFSRDGHLLAIVALDSSARIFDVQAHQPLGGAFASDPDAPITLRPDGRALAVAVPQGDTDYLQVWSLDPAAWRAAACLEAGRNLTRAEFAQYIGGPYHATCTQWPAGGA